MATRVAQDTLEILALPDGMAQVVQAAAEALVQPDTRVRAAQVTQEVLVGPATAQGQLSQIVIEVLLPS